MPVTVKFFATFREAFGGRERKMPFEDGASLKSLLESLCDTPARRSEIFEGDILKPYVVVMRNGSPAGSPEELEKRLDDGDVVAVFPFVGGG
jgi:molybdopterin synthase sulfur carrier subunit